MLKDRKGGENNSKCLALWQVYLHCPVFVCGWEWEVEVLDPIPAGWMDGWMEGHISTIHMVRLRLIMGESLNS